MRLKEIEVAWWATHAIPAGKTPTLLEQLGKSQFSTADAYCARMKDDVDQMRGHRVGSDVQED